MDILIFLVVALIVLALVGWLLTLIPMDQALRNVIMVLVIVICILVILRRLGYV